MRRATYNEIKKAEGIVTAYQDLLEETSDFGEYALQNDRISGSVVDAFKKVGIEYISVDGEMKKISLAPAEMILNSSTLKEKYESAKKILDAENARGFRDRHHASQRNRNNVNRNRVLSESARRSLASPRGQLDMLVSGQATPNDVLDNSPFVIYEDMLKLATSD